MAKKNTYKVLAEALAFDGLKDFNPPAVKRKLSVNEIKEFIKEEFGKARKASDEEAEEKPLGWSDDVLEKEIDWVKQLDIKESF